MANSAPTTPTSPRSRRNLDSPKSPSSPRSPMSPRQLSAFDRTRSKLIDQQLRDEAKELKEQPKAKKIILLGSSDCGKTTILKQLKLVYGKGFSKEELTAYKKSARDNVFDSVASLIEGMRALDLFPKEESLFWDMAQFEGHNRIKGSVLSEQMIDGICRIWANAQAQQAFERRNEFQIQDTAEFFITNAKRLCSEAFVPSDEECLLIRVITTCITVTRLRMESLIDVIDVGGGQSFRFRWAPYLNDELTFIFYVTSVGSYDQQLDENRKVSRMDDSIDLFQTICKNKLLAGVPIMVFLNKVDLLEQKILKSPLQKYCPDYNPAPDQSPVRAALSYFGKRFSPDKSLEPRKVYHHVSKATDTKLMKTILGLVAKVIADQSAKSVGIF